MYSTKVSNVSSFITQYKIAFALVAIILCPFFSVQSYAQSDIIYAEWFLDNDPGFANASSIHLTPSTNLQELAINIDPETLTSGVHQFTVRAKDANGIWSLNQRWLFFKSYNSSSSSGLLNITSAEWYLDNDPGLGNGMSIPITASTNLNDLLVNIDPTTLSSGVHQFTVRAKDANGNWSLNQKWLFFKSYNSSSASGLPAIKSAEWFLDNDPGLGNGTSIPVTGSSDLNGLIVNIDPASLSSGVHQFTVRAMDVNSNWSLNQRWLFFKSSNPGNGPSVPKLTYVEYYIDSDPGMGKGISVAIPQTTVITDFDMAVDINGLAIGNYTLYLRSKDENGSWSLMNKWAFKVDSASQRIFALGKIISNTCAGSPVSVPVIVDIAFGAANIFTAQLSNSAGSFDNPLNIGTLTATSSDTIKATIPSNTPAGTNYRIRVIATIPGDTTAYNDSAIAILRAPGQSFSITGKLNVCMGSENYSVSSPEAGVTYTWKLGGYLIDSNATAISINWDTVGRYTLTVVPSNSCGNGVAKTLNVSVSDALTMSPLLSHSSRTLKASLLPLGAAGYHWYKNGTLILGVVDSIYYAAAAGIYTVKFFNSCGDGTASNSIEFTNDLIPQTITFPAIPDKTFEDAPFPLTATASSTLPIKYTIVSGAAFFQEVF